LGRFSLASSPQSARIYVFLEDGMTRHELIEISRRVAATCVGGFTLAEAGLLDEKQATTHWDYARELQMRYPKVKVQEDRIFVIDGSIWTSAGMTATMDLVLAWSKGISVRNSLGRSRRKW
jgi:transcriptional regulator GlxA family with amidase domain